MVCVCTGSQLEKKDTWLTIRIFSVCEHTIQSISTWQVDVAFPLLGSEVSSLGED